MEELRRAARESLQQADSHALPAIILAENTAIPDSLELLWQDILSRNSGKDLEICEELLVAQGFLDHRGSKGLTDQDENVVNCLYDWASNAALPGPVFAEEFDLDMSDVEKEGIIESSRLRLTIAISVLSSLAALLPIEKAANKPDIVIALASFTTEDDPWTTKPSVTKATEVLQSFTTTIRADMDPSFWSVVEQVLKERIKPLFAKTRNPAITATGRKNFHPVPLPRFDASVLDPESKPWKIHDVYATTVFAWAISQYHSTDRGYLERHFPLLVPPTLTLIDDDSLSCKTRGCSLLLQLLKPIRESQSDILRRTNLSSVFEDAIKHCFFSLPTITPEDDSIRLLGVAYPALFSVLKTAYQIPLGKKTTDQDIYIGGIIKILRDHLIPSFHHIGSTNTTSPTVSFASFPHPRLSTLLVNQMCTAILEIGIHTTKYLQEIIPVLYSTLSNPFGPAHVPLLLSSVAAARTVILNAHPRLWRWRGEILGGVCSCWVYAVEEEEQIAERASRGQGAESDEATGAVFVTLKRELKGIIYLLKFALENPVQVGDDAGQLEAKQCIGNEIRELVDADDTLGELLLADIDPDDGGYFGLGR